MASRRGVHWLGQPGKHSQTHPKNLKKMGWVWSLGGYGFKK